jgi:hypothetical protein
MVWAAFDCNNLIPPLTTYCLPYYQLPTATAIYSITQSLLVLIHHQTLLAPPFPLSININININAIVVVIITTFKDLRKKPPSC